MSPKEKLIGLILPSSNIRPLRKDILLHLHWLTYASVHKMTDDHTHPFNGLFSKITQVSRYQKGKTNLDFTEARDSEWQWQPHASLHLAPDR